ncbi:MAG TPA: bifunctional glutamate N-acetyltransferase/amino-acid acetyltransferase ArgJ [Aggregatilineaceae bacterium]|nr:bifunctional glutamate N-acetyltransferase/amino-acid acetyltransferase ArgJ [Aggregatilineaceae bacterium]
MNGFLVAGLHCGLKRDERKDIALLYSDRPCTAAGVFTTNKVKAAPVLYDQALLADPHAQVRAVLINTGSANACTGEPGLANTRTSAAQVAQAVGCAPAEVLALSTGVIGLPLPMDRMTQGITQLTQQLRADGWDDAAAAIMTTDTRPKKIEYHHPDGYTLIGIAKGAGMIAPNMATMLSVIVTDAAVSRPMLEQALHCAVDQSFNRIVVDGDMSTNDSLLVLANGASGVTVQDEASFTAALTEVCVSLAQAIVRDGEGATKFVTLHVTGAPDEAAARTIAHQIGTSALVKTAFYGGDPNWGRILCAAGYSGVDLDPARLSLWLLHADGSLAIQLVEGGQPLDYDEPAAIQLMQGTEWGVRLDLGLGDVSTWLWTCDLSHEYVTINGHYRT